MDCHKCGSSKLKEQMADLPFRISLHKILVVKDTPSVICMSCGEIVIADEVMARIDEIIEKIQSLDSELEVVHYAA